MHVELNQYGRMQRKMISTIDDINWNLSDDAQTTEMNKYKIKEFS